MIRLNNKQPSSVNTLLCVKRRVRKECSQRQYNCSPFGYWELFQVDFMLFDAMVLFYLFLITSLFSGTIRCSRLFCILSAPELEQQVLHRGLIYFIGNQYLFHQLCSLHYFGEMHTYIYTIYVMYILIYLYKCIHANKCLQMPTHLYLLCIYQPVCVCICTYDIHTHIHITTSQSHSRQLILEGLFMTLQSHKDGILKNRTSIQQVFTKQVSCTWRQGYDCEQDR